MLQKYFIAIVPSEPVLSGIEAVKRGIFEAYGTKGALKSPGHITLHMPFSFEEDKEDKLITCLESFRFHTSFDISLQNFGCFEPRVIFINIKDEENLFELQKQLVRHVRRNLNLFNQSDDRRGFHPHVTVAFRDLKRPVFYKVWEEFKVKSFLGSFKCFSIALLKHDNERWHIFREFNFGLHVV